MKDNTIIIFSSSRSDGNTKKAINSIFINNDVPLIDLKEKNISFFDYASKNKEEWVSRNIFRINQ